MGKSHSSNICWHKHSYNPLISRWQLWGQQSSISTPCNRFWTTVKLAGIAQAEKDLENCIWDISNLDNFQFIRTFSFPDWTPPWFASAPSPPQQVSERRRNLRVRRRQTLPRSRRPWSRSGPTTASRTWGPSLVGGLHLLLITFHPLLLLTICLLLSPISLHLRLIAGNHFS